MVRLTIHKLDNDWLLTIRLLNQLDLWTSLNQYFNTHKSCPYPLHYKLYPFCFVQTNNLICEDKTIVNNFICQDKISFVSIECIVSFVYSKYFYFLIQSRLFYLEIHLFFYILEKSCVRCCFAQKLNERSFSERRAQLAFLLGERPWVWTPEPTKNWLLPILNF